MNSAELLTKLRHAKTPIIARIDEDRLFFELRTLTEKEDQNNNNTCRDIELISDFGMRIAGFEFRYCNIYFCPHSEISDKETKSKVGNPKSAIRNRG